MSYFSSCKNLDELKSLFRTLAKEHHPDRGGDTATMQKINLEYESAKKRLKNSSNNHYNAAQDFAEKMRREEERKRKEREEQERKRKEREEQERKRKEREEQERKRKAHQAKYKEASEKCKNKDHDRDLFGKSVYENKQMGLF